MKVHKQSPVSGELNSMELDITLSQYAKWINGELIQNAMPDLSDEEREFLITGMTPEEQEAMYKSLEEE